MELKEISVILRYKLATYNKQMSKWPCVSLFQILSAMFLPNISICLQSGKLSQKQKG